MVRPRRFLLVLAVLIGIPIGVGFFTFSYAEGLSYMSNDPKACANCHIMNDHYDSWAKSTHHHVAVCNDCHTPHDMFGKYVSKARNGWNHSYAFTLQNFKEPLRITPKNSEILQENCVRCHADIVHDSVMGHVIGTQSLDCMHCHRSVGHGATR